MKTQLIYITATDTGVGKTITTAALALILRQQGKQVGVIKPVQCAGDDASWLKKILDLSYPLSVINPIYAPEPLSPHLALRRSKKKFELKKIKSSIYQLAKTCDVILLEGAGGLLVPLADNYTNADLIKDLNASVIIVSRLGLGTINHTLLTLEVAKRRKINVLGIIFSDTNRKPKSLPEKTNPHEIERLSGVKVLGIIPFLKKRTAPEIFNQCQHIQLV